ncbi:MAG TPA: sigma-70 family RNA polymerase sigma factor [Terriglobales bacterium]|nr:sigma-70 family RNA polymerase sigma factor [Terriglobales bacterium]
MSATMMGTGQVTLSDTMLMAATQTSGAGTPLEAALTDIVRERARLVYQIAYSVLRNHHDAEDASQEVFLRVWRYRAKLADVDDVKAWVARIAWRVAVERGARRGKTTILSLDDEAQTAIRETLSDGTTDAATQAGHRQMQAWLELTIPTLPEDLRGPLLLSTVQELNSAEIAEVLQISEGTVRTRLFRARKMLKDKLAKTLGRRP